MKKGFVFGKFYPFHNGHKAMIEFALTKGAVTVLVCAEKFELIDGQTRARWISDTFSNQGLNIDVQLFEYDDREFPSTSEASQDISKKWSEVFLEKFPDYDFFVTSEAYGKYVAEASGFEHIMFDEARAGVNVSATEIRENIYGNWHHLPKAVRYHFMLKVVILGTESTGKTELVNSLADLKKCNRVHEAGREMVEGSKNFHLDDLYQILWNQPVRITEAKRNTDSYLIIIDTDYNITQSYAKYVFDHDLKVGDWVKNASKADLYLYLRNNVPFIQDGTRFDVEDRNRLDKCHRYILHQNGIEYEEIESDKYWMRELEATMAIEAMVKRKSCLK